MKKQITLFAGQNQCHFDRMKSLDYLVESDYIHKILFSEISAVTFPFSNHPSDDPVSAETQFLTRV